jgi:tetratricopeptide (TPR) repeat protein
VVPPARWRSTVLLLLALAVLWGRHRFLELDGAWFRASPTGLYALAAYEAGYYATAADAYRRHLAGAIGRGQTTWDEAQDALLVGDLEGARGILAERRAADPADPEPRVTEALLHLRAGDLEAARATLDAVRGEHPRHFDGNVLASVVYARLGAEDAAIALANRALRDSGWLRFTVRLEVLDIVDALRRSQRSRALRAHYHRYLRIVDAAQGPVAVREAGTAIASGDHVADAHFTIGVVEYRQGRPDVALAAFSAAVEATAEHAEALRWVALVYAERGDLMREIEMRERAAEAAPDDARYRTDLARALIYKVGDEGHALRVLDALPPQYERDVNVVGLRARALLGVGRHEDALPLFRRAIELEPGNASRFEMFGWALSRLRRYDAALVAYEEARRLAPGRSDPHLEMAYLLDHLNRPSEAADTYQRGLDRLPAREVLRRRGDLCHFLFRAGRLDEARVCALRVVRFNTFDETMKYIARIVPADPAAARDMWDEEATVS